MNRVNLQSAEVTEMKKSILKVCCVATALLAVIALLGAITVTGSGFIDLSNLARYVLIAIAVLFAIIAFVTGRKGWGHERAGGRNDA